MTLETFFEKFDQFADAPDAVEKMREIVLQFAVSGKFFGTTNWEPTSLSQVCDRIHYGYTAKANPEIDKVRMLRITDIQNNQVNWPTVPGCEITEKDLPKYCLSSGDILIARTGGTVGKSFLVREEPPPAVFASYLIRLQPSEAITPDYLKRFLESPTYWLQLIAAARGAAQPNVNGKTLGQIKLPLPPLAEQKRIVAKVDELMALCDQLETQQQERDAQASQLARATLARFTDAPTPANLNLLFNPLPNSPFFTPHSHFISPADLRKSILTLAVQGKLVPQDPNDEPAEAELSSQGIDLKRWGSSEDQKRHEVPNSWTWLRFAGVGEQRLGKMLDKGKNQGNLKPYLRNTNVQWMHFKLEDIKEMRLEEREEEDLCLKNGDLLICEGGEPGRCAIWREQIPEMYFQKALHRVRPCAAVLSEFLALNLQVDCENGVLPNYFTGATIKHLTGRSLKSYPIPIPPLAEQHRIVAKVDQLMALVDELETQLTDSRATAKNLLEALVAELTTHNSAPSAAVS